jgi:NDP-sugar pyrophosphorylase family protein
VYPVAILCGGLGTRMHPVTETVPKALIPVNDEPFVAHQLRLLAQSGFERAVLCVGHMGDMIEAFVGDGTRFGLRAGYSYDGDTRLGTAGALRKALPQLGEHFFVVYGDSYTACDYRAVQAAFERDDATALMTVFHNRGALEPSNVVFANGRVERYEKGATDPEFEYIDYGVSIFSAEAFATLPDGVSVDLAGVVASLIEQRKLAGYEIASRFYEIGSPTGLAETEALLGRPSTSSG